MDKRRNWPWMNFVWTFFLRASGFPKPQQGSGEFTGEYTATRRVVLSVFDRDLGSARKTLFCYIILHSNKPRRQKKGKLPAVSNLQSETREPSTQNILDRLIFAKVYIKMKKCKIKVILSLKIKSNYL